MSKTFSGQRAINDVSFDIQPGEIHALVGENGSGKSTLIKALSGFHNPDPGSEILVAGEQLPHGNPPASIKAGLRFVHQDLALVDALSAAENVGLASGYATRGGRINWRRQRARAEALIGRLGIDIDVDVRMSELSAVERSVVAIARALDDTDGELRMLVLDEPTAALPPSDVERLFMALREIKAQGISILYVSHRLGEVLGLADRVSALRDGKYLGTYDTKTLDTASLAELIVGRPIEELHAGSHTHSADEPQPVVLDVAELSSDTLCGVAFQLRRGEIVGFAGIDGSGRESLATALTGMSPATMRLTVEGGNQHRTLSYEQARQLGLALVLPNSHTAAAVREMTVRENITLADMGLIASKPGMVNQSKDVKIAQSWIKKLQIAPVDTEQLYGKLSGGNRQKVCMARGLIGKPKVLVLDNPTSGVDIGARRTLYDVVNKLSDEGMATILSSADIEDLVGLADRVFVLVDGRVIRELVGIEITESNMLGVLAGRSTDTLNELEIDRITT